VFAVCGVSENKLIIRSATNNGNFHCVLCKLVRFVPIIYPQYLYWYLDHWYWYKYLYVSLMFWYWYLYLFVEYLIQDWLNL